LSDIKDKPRERGSDSVSTTEFVIVRATKLISFTLKKARPCSVPGCTHMHTPVIAYTITKFNELALYSAIVRKVESNHYAAKRP